MKKYFYLLLFLLLPASISYSQSILNKSLKDSSSAEKNWGPELHADSRRTSILLDKVEKFALDSIGIKICKQDTIYMLFKTVHRFSIIGPKAGRIWNKEFEIRFIEIDTTESETYPDNYKDEIVIANKEYFEKTKKPILWEYDKYTRHLEKRDSLFKAAVEYCYGTSLTDVFFVIIQTEGVFKRNIYNLFPECFEDPRLEDLINH